MKKQTGLGDGALTSYQSALRASAGDLWLLGDHRLLCGDSTDPHDVSLVMHGEKTKLMATVPPCTVGYGLLQ